MGCLLMFCFILIWEGNLLIPGYYFILFLQKILYSLCDFNKLFHENDLSNKLMGEVFVIIYFTSYYKILLIIWNSSKLINKFISYKFYQIIAKLCIGHNIAIYI